MEHIFLQADDFWTIANIKDLITVIGFPIAILTFIITQQITKNQARATNMINLLNLYLKTSEYRRDALIEKKEAKILLYWTSLMDLHWTQYDLWNRGYINNRAMRIWCYDKYRDYKSNFEITDDTGKSFTYKTVWDMHIEQEYFPPGDDFTTIMNKIHEIKSKNTTKINEKIKENLSAHRKHWVNRFFGIE